MSRMYESPSNNGGKSMSSIDEYLSRINRMHRTPTIVEDFSDTPPHYNSAYPPTHNDHRVRFFSENNHQAPEVVHKKVHFTQHEIYEEKTIDVEADGFIQRRHKNFESCNTFKGY